MQAGKVRTSDGWGNRCKACGSIYPAPPPALTYRRRQQRKARNKELYLEAKGQRRLFPR